MTEKEFKSRKLATNFDDSIDEMGQLIAKRVAEALASSISISMQIGDQYGPQVFKGELYRSIRVFKIADGYRVRIMKPYAEQVEFGLKNKVWLPFITNDIVTELGMWATEKLGIKYRWVYHKSEKKSHLRAFTSDGKRVYGMFVGASHPHAKEMVEAIRNEHKQEYEDLIVCTIEDVLSG